MVKKSLLCLMGLLVGVIYSYQVGTSMRRDATGLNHTYHMRHWYGSEVFSIVYHSGISYEGHYVLYEYGGSSEEYTFDDTGESNVAYPSIAVSYPIECNSFYPIEAIAYMAGSIGARNVDIPPYTISIPVGEEIKVAIHNPRFGTSSGWTYLSVLEVGGGDRVGIPHITYAYTYTAVDNSSADIHFVITFVRYYDYEYYDHDIHVYELIVTVDNSGTLTYTLSQISAMGGMYPINPSTAVGFWFGEDPEEEGLLYLIEYLHIAWKQPLDGAPGAIGYRVFRHDMPDPDGSWTHLGTVVLETDEEYSVYNFDPHISVFGDRVFLVWSREENYPNRLGEIRRIRKFADEWDYPGDHWSSRELISNDSESYASTAPQSQDVTVVWVEQDHTNSSNSQIWLRHYDPDYGGVDEGGIVSDLSTSLDTFPNIDCLMPAWDMTMWYPYVLWTHGASSPYTVECIRAPYSWPPWMMRLLRGSGGNNLANIAPDLPIFSMITCGNSTPSPYCEKRDSYGNINGYPVDIGNQELIYHFLPLEPYPRYLARITVVAPDTLIETFSFDGVSTSVTVTPEPDSFDFILPDSIYKDRYVKLKITGDDGVYLSNIKIYQYEVMDTLHYSQRFKSIPSTNPAGLNDDLLVNPALFRSSLSIRYRTGEGRVNLSIYDISGRLVRTLVDTYTPKPIGSRISWEGRDDTGKSLPPGVYFLKLRTKNSTLTKKVILVR